MRNVQVITVALACRIALEMVSECEWSCHTEVWPPQNEIASYTHEICSKHAGVATLGGAIIGASLSEPHINVLNASGV